MSRRSNVLRLLFLCFLAVCMCLPTAFGSVIPMQREEVIQRSEAIFVARVVEKKVRWNEQGNMIVTDYYFEVEKGLYGDMDNQIFLTFAGGELDGEKHQIHGVPEYHLDERVVLMVEDLRAPLFSPVTGMYQGSFIETVDKESGRQVVLNGEGEAILHRGEPIPFEAFIDLLAEEIPKAKAKPVPSRELPEHLQYLAIPTEKLPFQEYDRFDTEVWEDGMDPAPFKGSRDDNPDLDPRDQYVREEGEDGEGQYVPHRTHERDYSKWSYSHRAKSAPIVFNPLPSGGLIGLHDQYQMSYWNKYSDIFRVQASTGSWSWGNGRYDIAGFVNNATMVSQFGSGWGSSTLAVCWKRWDWTGYSVEADIAMNPAFSWTTNDYDTYANANLYNADRTLLHEIGHSWGLDHQFNFLSVMNYAPHKYRAYTVLSGDDTMAVRAAFSGKTVSRTDLGVALYYNTGYQSYSDSTLNKTYVKKGSTVTISNFMVENTGTATISSPSIRWYLVPNINNWSSSRYLGTTTHSSLAKDHYWLTSRTLTIPASTPTGWYYIGAYVNVAGDSVGNNNSSWCGRRIYVY